MDKTIENSLGKYSIEIGDSHFQKRISHLEIQLGLDQCASLKVSIAEEGRSIQQGNLSRYPKDATFRWAGKGIFKGHLTQVYLSGHRSVQLVYEDALLAAHKHFENDRKKEVSLNEVLSQISRYLGLSPKFYGDFSDKLDNVNLGGQSLYALLENLAEFGGFFFGTHSLSQTLNFIRVGHFINKVEWDCSQKTASLQQDQGSGAFYKTVSLRYMNPAKGQAEDRDLSDSEIYQPCGEFKSHTGFKVKQNWTLAKGKINAYVANQKRFQTGAQWIKSELSKKAFYQESLRIKCFEPIGFPGDKLQLKNPPAKEIQNGSFLIKNCRIQVSSALPTIEILAIRP